MAGVATDAQERGLAAIRIPLRSLLLGGSGGAQEHRRRNNRHRDFHGRLYLGCIMRSMTTGSPRLTMSMPFFSAGPRSAGLSIGPMPATPMASASFAKLT